MEGYGITLVIALNAYVLFEQMEVGFRAVFSSARLSGQLRRPLLR